MRGLCAGRGIFFLGLILAVGSWGGSVSAQVFTSGPVEKTPASDPEPVGTWAASVEAVEIISINGSATVMKNGASAEVPAEEGMLLSSGDTITTGAGSFVDLGFDDEDKNVVRVEAKSTSIILLKGSEKIELVTGEVFSSIRNLPAGTSFEVVTPTAVAGARGTEWVTRYSGEETEVEAYDDEPFVKTINEKGEAGEETRVKPGFATRIAKFGSPTAPAQIPVARQQRWQNMRQAMQQRVQSVRERRGRPDRAAFVHGGQKGAASGGLKAGSEGRKSRPSEGRSVSGPDRIKKEPASVQAPKDKLSVAAKAADQARAAATAPVDKRPAVSKDKPGRVLQANMPKATGAGARQAVRR